MRKIKALLLALLLLPSLALAANGNCTVCRTVTTASTTILPANDIPLTSISGRVRWVVENAGTTDAYCAVGSSNTASQTNGMLIVANGGNWTESAFQSYGLVSFLPPGDISCATAFGSTTVCGCDY